MKTHCENILVRKEPSKEIFELAILKEKDKEEYRICNLTKGHICKCIFDSYEDAYTDIERYQKERKNTILGLKREGIKLVNLDLTGITPSDEYVKVKEENKEFEIAVFECLCNPIEENKLHAIEEFWDKVQSSLSYLQITLDIKADEVMENYNLHLEKIKNRPR